ncbi:MAG: type III pantothenate kinase [Thermodesulfobacteriota bacterium]
MLLAIDIGNTHTVIGLFQDSNLTQHWRLRTDRQVTADELAATLQGLFAIRGLALNAVSGVVIASVVPTLGMPLRQFCANYLDLAPVFVTGELTHTMAIHCDHPGEVGADRIVNGLAAREKYGFPAIIVDFGTAITFDCIDASGSYIGGAIIPGMAIALDALSTRTAKLPRIDISTPPRRAIGTNTEDAIRAGMLFGYGGMIEEILRRIQTELAVPARAIIATGGMAGLIAPYAPSIAAVDPMLTLEGIRIFHEQLPG